ncbi:5-bromo-4-chloroindolyl phosphate hydrolysis family protein [Sediminicoccus sp. KRV36]|uniref:5-bromo-4-chloroindolyl phosphate hydrolysis family protein n=1 Tax=Sediminicoccus sp. KRV36 TaxID=3133721 RepID=UPI00200FEDFD|nr:5-bromo-4-chloroindolyl phosphate hydrolysis family protein [Sediminicoccus rosea]UPY34860.1 5-bromo-4-chloroindolyl phosphate hydrolysis family protein [Sediminicoccus rosea]
MAGWTEQKRAWKQQAREVASRPVFGWRVWLLPMFFWPLMLDLPVEIIRGNPKHLVGAMLGLGLSWYGASLMARGRRRQGAKLFGVAAGLAAGLAAGITPPIAVALGFGAWFGVRLLTDDLPEAVPEAPPEPVQAPTKPDLLDGPRAQLARIAGAAPTLPLGTLLLEAAGAMQGVVEDLEARPARLHEARRFLAVHLDGLSRIVDRLEAGAAPPGTLPSLLTDLAASARKLRSELRVAESEALDIQVKVLAERLRQEET